MFYETTIHHTTHKSKLPLVTVDRINVIKISVQAPKNKVYGKINTKTKNN